MQNGKELVGMGSGAAEIIAGGETMVQTQVGYQTAVAVQRRRDIDQVVKNVEREAEYAAGGAYYAWQVTDRKTGKKVTVEGLSIGGEMAIAREWGNCAIPVEIQVTPDSYIFTASFVDLEKGFTVTRVFRQTKTEAPGKYDADRWADMQLQIGQSKAIRNAIKAGTPAWLQDRAMKISKQAVIDGINKEGLQHAITRAIDFLASHGITEANIVETMGLPINEWTAKTVATLRGMCQQINDGTERPESLFGIEPKGKTSDLAADINKKTGEIKTPPPETEKKKTPAKKTPAKKPAAKKPAAKKIDESELDALEDAIAVLEKFTTEQDVNEWLKNYRETIKERLPTLSKKLFDAVEDHIKFIKMVAAKESKENKSGEVF